MTYRRGAAAAAAIASLAFLIGRRRRSTAGLMSAVAPDLRRYVPLIPRGILTADWSEVSRPPAAGGRLLDRLVPRGIGRPITIPGPDGADIPAFQYDPPGRQRQSGAVLWLHGGGMVIGSPWMDHGVCTRVAEELGAVVISPAYRLAPEHPFPAGPEDCFAALSWLHAHAAELGIDPQRVAVGGESAGGGLAAIVTQMAQDRGVPVAFQALVYPMLDDRTVLADRGRDVGRLVWNPGQNRAAWQWFLGHPISPDEPRRYASAARREDLAGLPPAWIGGGHDRPLP
ncbi:MAG: alpha/beta hydrolase [Acidipropionibacterium acidipropionici]|jgi:acetyl esterase/lipase|uniref:alpha/beta hydrolase n=1 Tax=Acidipropionibacterium acidipropionici TaxID=1748 RepID=UPI0004065309|nr:alpha/beta hydrolase [Acidipropionibacterium acidipropionici]ALN15323.1 hypothetical protein ASQ49_08635 [Acidipropionibacterium acidipropionici]